jgi:hypothetical protein
MPTTFPARPIMAGQPWSCVIQLRARDPGPAVDLTGADLVCAFRSQGGASTALVNLTGAGITLIHPDEVRLELTGAQTRKLPVGSITFALGRRDGGLRDLTHAIIWPVRLPINHEMP